jgi:hypothetical protein
VVVHDVATTPATTPATVIPVATADIAFIFLDICFLLIVIFFSLIFLFYIVFITQKKQIIITIFEIFFTSKAMYIQ